MEEKAVEPNINLEEFIFQIEKDLPTGRTVHDEIGLSWEIIATEVYKCSRNNVEKCADLLPKVYYTVHRDEAAQEVISCWEKVIETCGKFIVHQEGRITEIEKRWKRERPKYERALRFYAQFLRPTEDELTYIREQIGNQNYAPGYDGEYDVLDVAYDEIAASNKSKLLEKMEIVLEKLPIEQSQKLMAFYGGYPACTS